MKIDIFTHPHYRFEADRIYDEANRLGHESRLITYDKLSAYIEEEIVLRIDGRNLDLPNASLFRTYSYSDKTNYKDIAKIVREYYRDAGVRVFNSVIMKNKNFNKFNQQMIFTKNGLPYIKTYYFQSYAEFRDNALSYPLVAKPLAGSHGNGVYKIMDESQASRVFQEREIRGYIFQELMRESVDYRVLVLGGVVLGAMEREGQGGSFVNNISSGGVGRKAELDKEAYQLSIDATHAVGAEYAGVDLIVDQEGKWRILEINRFAEFRGFEKYLKINVAEAIIKYLVENA